MVLHFCMKQHNTLYWTEMKKSYFPVEIEILQRALLRKIVCIAEQEKQPADLFLNLIR